MALNHESAGSIPAPAAANISPTSVSLEFENSVRQDFDLGQQPNVTGD